MADQPVVFVLGQEPRYGFPDFGIGKLFDDILGVSMEREKVIKLAEGPYAGFPHMEGGIMVRPF